MKPKPNVRQAQRELFRVELEQLVDAGHPLVKLGQQINWAGFEERLGATYAVANGAPGRSTRLLVALHYLKYQHDLSDEAVVQHWVENPYWQHFSGEQFFQHEWPIDPSSMTRWRQRLGEAGAETMLKETIETGLRMKAIKPTQIQRVNVDTTVQTKAVRFPTDARLYNRARERLVKTARDCGLKIKQSYERVGPQLLMRQSRYAHARQMNRAQACTRKLRTNLGRVLREILRQQPAPTGRLQRLVATAQRIHAQQRSQANKVYSVHEPEICCIAKGKAARSTSLATKRASPPPAVAAGCSAPSAGRTIPTTGTRSTPSSPKSADWSDRKSKKRTSTWVTAVMATPALRRSTSTSAGEAQPQNPSGVG